MARAVSRALYFQRIIGSLIKFIAQSGVDLEDLRQMVDSQFDQVEKTKFRKSASPMKTGIDAVYALVLHRWHRDPRLVTELGEPLPIRLFGRHPSVESLVRSERPKSSARKIALSMKDAGLVIKEGPTKYRPTSRIARFPPLHPSLVEHVSSSITRLLDTVAQNAARKDSSVKLIERYAQVPDLPNTEIQNFCNLFPGSRDRLSCGGL
jgi:hypothetical protein